MPNTPDEALDAQAHAAVGVGFSRVLHCEGLPQQQARRIAKVRLNLRSPSVTLRWPNPLGERPEGALGKRVRLEEGGVPRDFSVEAAEGDKLILRSLP